MISIIVIINHIISVMVINLNVLLIVLKMKFSVLFLFIALFLKVNPAKIGKTSIHCENCPIGDICHQDFPNEECPVRTADFRSAVHVLSIYVYLQHGFEILLRPVLHPHGG